LTKSISTQPQMLHKELRVWQTGAGGLHKPSTFDVYSQTKLRTVNLQENINQNAI